MTSSPCAHGHEFVAYYVLSRMEEQASDELYKGLTLTWCIILIQYKRKSASVLRDRPVRCMYVCDMIAAVFRVAVVAVVVV
jgi:hypothetical protein